MKSVFLVTDVLIYILVVITSYSMYKSSKRADFMAAMRQIAHSKMAMVTLIILLAIIAQVTLLLGLDGMM